MTDLEILYLNLNIKGKTFYIIIEHTWFPYAKMVKRKVGISYDQETNVNVVHVANHVDTSARARLYSFCI